MSEAQPSGETLDEEYRDGLTDEELAAAERLKEKYEDDELGRICEVVLQSSAAAGDNEEANS